MSPGSNKRPTGTVPKAKTTRKNSVPQEMVAPTRRDLQQHLNDFFASVQRVSAKTDNNRTAGEGNCFELENFSLPENTRSCWPVRPIPRRNFMHEASTINDSHPLNLSTGPNQSSGSNAAIGVVIPTTPNSTLHHQQQNHINEQLLQHNHHQHHHHQYSTMNNLTATPPTSSLNHHPASMHNNLLQNHNLRRNNLSPDYDSNAVRNESNVGRMSQLAVEMAISNNLLQSNAHPNVSRHNHHSAANDSNVQLNVMPSAAMMSSSMPMTSTATGLVNGLNVEERLNQIQDYIRITTTLLDSIQAEKPNGPRPQSVTSMHTASTPNTPTYEELQSKLETSNRNIMHIKEQQQQLLRLQQAAKNNLYEMEQIRSQQKPLSFSNSDSATMGNSGSGGGGGGGGGVGSLPDYDNETEAQNDVRALMSRIKNLSDFVRNQNDLASSMGIEDNEKPELIEEQLQLQKKLDELKTKKQQMANLVNELQSMSVQAENNFDDDAHAAGATTRVPNLQSHHDIGIGPEFERIAPRQSTPNCFNSTSSDVVKCLNEKTVQSNPSIEDGADDDDNEDDDGATGGDHDDILHDKIAEINAMKEQLKRLQDMMHTVKLIEIKNGDCDPDADTDAVAALNFNDSNVTAKPLNASIGEDPQRDDDEEQEMAERVRALHNMTHDLRQQAVSLAAERDRLKNIKNEMSRRRDCDHGSDKNFKQQQLQFGATTTVGSGAAAASSTLKDANDDCDYDKLDNNNANDHIKKEPLAADPSLFFATNWPAPAIRQPPTSASLPPRHHHHSDATSSIKPSAVQNCSQGKDSADSGAADVLLSVDASSLKSESSRGFSVPPPMRNINTRDGPWRKSSQEISRISSSAANNQPSHHHQSFENPTEQNSPWYWHNGSCYNSQSYNPAGPQSPHCHYYHHMGGSEPHYCRPACSVPPTMSLPASHISSGSNDPMLLQQFIQTQQMLINSMSQCNQLLWDQQREINNLNSTVLVIQERLLNSTVNANMLDANQSNVLRAESVPPNVVCTNTGEFLPRAQSEQPNFQQQLATSSPFRQYTTPSTVQPTTNLPVYRGLTTATGTGNVIAGPNIRLLRQNSLLLNAGRAYFDSDHSPSQYSNNYLNGNAAATTDTSNILLNNNSNPNSSLLNNNNNHNINNNINNNNNNATPQCQSSPQHFIYHNNNTGATNNANITNQLQQQQHQPANTLTNAPVAAAAATPAALNNQVAPGNRANNYWDNFRSYSRQNLLSSSSCKSNEDVCNTLSNASSSHSSSHRDRGGDHHPQSSSSSSYANQNIALPYNGNSARNAAPTQMTHNNLPNMGNNKYLIQFRNQINQQHQQQQQQQNTPDVLNINQQRNYQQHDMIESSTNGGGGAMLTNTNYNNLNVTNASATAQEGPIVEVAAINNQQYLLACSGASGGSTAGNTPETNSQNSLSGLHTVVNNINSFNFDLNELKQPKMTTKTVQKCSTGGSKRIRSQRGSGSASDRENNLGASPLTLSSSSAAAAAAAVATAAAAATSTSIAVNDPTAHDLNLARMTNNNCRLDTKSSAKLFDDLKENVYLEVSALIAANESRPHFLINLFRELQLISTSDPLRTRLMEAFQELYTQYCETEPSTATIVPPIVEMQTSNVQNDLENPQQDTNQSNEHILNYNQHAGRNNYAASSSDSVPLCVPDLQSSIDEGFLRTIILDIRVFLRNEPAAVGLSDTALQRIASIILRYLSDADTNATKALNSQSSIDFDEILAHLFRLDRQNNDKFLEQLQNYLSFMLFSPLPSALTSPSSLAAVTTASVHIDPIQNDRIEQQQQPHQQQHHQQQRFDRCGYLSLPSNENLLTQRKNDGTIVIVRPQVPSTIITDNQDLAEADQLCQPHDENSAVNTLSQTEPNDSDDDVAFHSLQLQPSNENEIIVDMVSGTEIGAVGGISQSQLPDLAKVSTTSARILSLEEESACLVNADVQSYEMQMHQQNNRDFQHTNDSVSAERNSSATGNESDVVATKNHK